jgi:hypothetical protein
MRARRRRAVGMWSTWSLRKVVHISISPLYRATPEFHTFTEKELHYHELISVEPRLIFGRIPNLPEYWVDLCAEFVRTLPPKKK